MKESKFTEAQIVVALQQTIVTWTSRATRGAPAPERNRRNADMLRLRAHPHPAAAHIVASN